MSAQSLQPSEFLLYTSSDGNIKVDVIVNDETVWLTQEQMAELFQKGRTTIVEHIGNIYKEGELEEKSVCRKFRRTGSDGKTYDVQYYNLDMIISVGYRVNSMRGTQFRIWATKRLNEYIIKGFTLDDERLKRGGTRNVYFDELIERIRDIRSSERNFYQKITDIYATSIDYDASSDVSRVFFATVQNKMHFGIHGKTAAEIIAERADGTKPTMGITCIPRENIRKADVFVAKNYLNEDELQELNLIVDQYLSFAELQARKRKTMTMEDWVRKLDDFLRLNEREILEHKGSISKELADDKASKEYEVFRTERMRDYVSDFDKETQKLLQQREKL